MHGWWPERRFTQTGPLQASHLAEVVEVALQHIDVGYEAVDDAAPRLVQRLVPYAAVCAQTYERTEDVLA